MRNHQLYWTQNLLMKFMSVMLYGSWMDGQYGMGTSMNDNHHAAFIHSSNCTTLCTDLVHMIEILKIAYGRSGKLSWRSSMRNGEEVGLCGIKNYRMDQHGVHCRPKVLECDSTTSGIDQIMWIVVDLALWGLEDVECTWLYIDKIWWLAMMTSCQNAYDCWICNDC